MLIPILSVLLKYLTSSPGPGPVTREEMHRFFQWFFPIVADSPSDDFTYRDANAKFDDDQEKAAMQKEGFTLSYVSDSFRLTSMHMRT